MKKFLFIASILLSTGLFAQDSIPSRKINAVWVEPEVVFETQKKQEEPVADVPVELESIKGDLEFLEKLPTSYDDVPKEDLKNVLQGIDSKINKLIRERDSLLSCKVVNEQLVNTKSGTIKSLEKEKEIINLTIESDDLKDENEDLSYQNTDLKTTKEQLKTYLYTAIGIAVLLSLIVAVILQRRRISVQDVAIEEQLNDINKKNTYLEHAAKIIRHDMHSGINTYMPRGLSSLEKRLTPEDIENFKIAGSLKMIKDGLAHTQRVYKSVYEFTNLVKKHVVLDKKKIDVKEILTKYLENTSYASQVQVSNLMELEVNETLFCNAIDNLVRNGLKYNNSTEKLVKIYMQNDCIVVEDNGIGMNNAKFEKAIKAEHEENSNGEIGLGLGISNAIFKEHGFSFTCEKSEGQGTLIKINIKK